MARCVDDPTASDFAVQAWSFVNRDPVLNNIICTFVEAAFATAARSAGSDQSDDWRWVRVLAGAELVGVAVQTPPRGPMVSDLPESAARALAAHFAGTDAGLSSVGGPDRAADAFAARYAELTGVGHHLHGRSRLFRLDRVESPRGVAGGARPATRADRDLILGWMRAFAEDAGLVRESGAEREAAFERRFAHGGLMWFWEVAGMPVSFAWRSPVREPVHWPRTSVARVGLVYTPPEHRGNGYASANVAALSQEALAGGASACMLYTDAANPTSNKIYQQIGYRQVGTANEWLFS